jgi:uncharacterized membrane protein
MRRFSLRRLLTPLVVAALLVAAFFLLRKQVLWLDYFEGTITERIDKLVPTVIDRHAQEISEYYLVVDTDDGRQVTVLVEQLFFFRAREGMRVRKSPFTLEVQLSQ